MFCFVMLCYVVLFCFLSCRVVLFYVASGCVASSCVALRCVALRCVALRCALFSVVLRIIFLFNPPFSLQQNELDSVNSAHSNRHQRYKNLQLEHKIVLEQLKTYENLR